jgi:hypothetical protein
MYLFEKPEQGFVLAGVAVAGHPAGVEVLRGAQPSRLQPELPVITLEPGDRLLAFVPLINGLTDHDVTQRRVCGVTGAHATHGQRCRAQPLDQRRSEWSCSATTHLRRPGQRHREPSLPIDAVLAPKERWDAVQVALLPLKHSWTRRSDRLAGRLGRIELLPQCRNHQHINAVHVFSRCDSLRCRGRCVEPRRAAQPPTHTLPRLKERQSRSAERRRACCCWHRLIQHPMPGGEVPVRRDARKMTELANLTPDPQVPTRSRQPDRRALTEKMLIKFLEGEPASAAQQ